MLLLLFSLNLFAYYSNDLDKPQNDSDEQIIVWEDFYITCKICDPEILVLGVDSEEVEEREDNYSF